MLLIYIPKLTNRIGYTLNVVFHHFLQTEYEITTSKTTYANHEGSKISYTEKSEGGGMFIRASGLLEKSVIEPQEVHSNTVDGHIEMFPTYNSKSAFTFDILASIFFCLSRYEEYLPHRTDMHMRFMASESEAFQNGFLQRPVVDEWVWMIAEKIKEYYPEEAIKPRPFDYEDTFDIDAAYCYKHKGVFRTLSGILKDIHQQKDIALIKRRLRVLRKKEDDPFDTFETILNEHREHPTIKLKFFPLMADYNVYDKSISYQCSEFRELLKHLNDYAKMGIHASYASYEKPQLLPIEIERLEEVLHRKIKRNRFHFLRFSIPRSYQELIENNITHDYSMGYAEEPGFRAGTCTPYPFFDLSNNAETALMIHPFAVMDSSLVFYKKMAVREVADVYKGMMESVYKVGGTFSALWHNPTLCDEFGWEGWQAVYKQIIAYGDRLKKESKNSTRKER